MRMEVFLYLSVGQLGVWVVCVSEYQSDGSVSLSCCSCLSVTPSVTPSVPRVPWASSILPAASPTWTQLQDWVGGLGLRSSVTPSSCYLVATGAAGAKDDELRGTL